MDKIIEINYEKFMIDLYDDQNRHFRIIKFEENSYVLTHVPLTERRLFRDIDSENIEHLLLRLKNYNILKIVLTNNNKTSTIYDIKNSSASSIQRKYKTYKERKKFLTGGSYNNNNYPGYLYPSETSGYFAHYVLPGMNKRISDFGKNNNKKLKNVNKDILILFKEIKN